MDKGIGFSRTITLDWLDVTASLCVQEIEPLMIRQQLAETISGVVHGVDAQRKTIDVLTAIWLRTEGTAPQIRQQALAIYQTVSSSTERLWLHYGMTLVCYPLFRKCTAAIGQISRFDDTITRKVIKERIAGDYGHLGALDRSVERIIASLTNWGVLSNTETKASYEIKLRSYTADDILQRWLLGCALFAHPSTGLPYNDLVRLPELFPFQLDIQVRDLRQDNWFEVQRQGGGLDIVRLR